MPNHWPSFPSCHSGFCIAWSRNNVNNRLHCPCCAKHLTDRPVLPWFPFRQGETPGTDSPRSMCWANSAPESPGLGLQPSPGLEEPPRLIPPCAGSTDLQPMLGGGRPQWCPVVAGCCPHGIWQVGGALLGPTAHLCNSPQR